MNRKLMVAFVTAALTSSTLSAQAADFAVSVANPKNLDPLAAVLQVSVANIPDGKGIYLQTCENTPVPGESCSAARSGAGASLWLTTAASSVRMGATLISSSAKVDFKFPASFTNSAGVFVDCTTDVNKCGVYSRADHLNSTDTTVKTFTAVSFLGAKPKAAVLIGSANNRVVLRVFGLAGQQVNVKIGGRWVTREISENNQVVSWKSPAKSVRVAAFSLGKELASVELDLR